MFKRKPKVYVWAGLATFASELAGKSMRQAYAGFFASFAIPDPVVGTSGRMAAGEIILTLGLGNFAIYTDMMSQHEAYDARGISEMKRLYDSGAIKKPIYDAWCKLHEGEKNNKPSLIFQAASEFADYEQKVALQKAIQGKELLLKLIGPLANAPLDNAQGFNDFLPKGDFSKGADRSAYAVDYLVPLWQQRLQTNESGIIGQVDAIVKKAIWFLTIDTAIKVGVTAGQRP